MEKFQDVLHANTDPVVTADNIQAFPKFSGVAIGDSLQHMADPVCQNVLPSVTKKGGYHGVRKEHTSGASTPAILTCNV